MLNHFALYENDIRNRSVKERCERVNLGYMNPDDINLADYENKEEEGILVVHHAGETLYRLSNGHVPTIPAVNSRQSG